MALTRLKTMVKKFWSSFEFHRGEGGGEKEGSGGGGGEEDWSEWKESSESKSGELEEEGV